jgi:5-methylcytosine-specific restriction protein A
LINFEQIGSLIDESLGLSSSYSFGNATSLASTWRFGEFPRPEGFYVELFEQFGVVRARLQLDAFASAMRGAIDAASQARWREIGLASKRFEDFGIEFQISRSGDSVESSKLPPTDTEFSIDGRLVKPTSLEEDAARLLKIMVELFSEIVTAGLGWKEAEFDFEGAKSVRAVTVYERSPLNRRLAIEIHGLTCAACNFNFSSKYGQIGDGVVEIHHKIPVHLMNRVEVVDPRTDLVPLCSNCHTIVHKTDPPISIEELKRLIEFQTIQNRN